MVNPSSSARVESRASTVVQLGQPSKYSSVTSFGSSSLLSAPDDKDFHYGGESKFTSREAVVRIGSLTPIDVAP